MATKASRDMTWMEMVLMWYWERFCGDSGTRLEIEPKCRQVGDNELMI